MWTAVLTRGLERSRTNTKPSALRLLRDQFSQSSFCDPGCRDARCRVPVARAVIAIGLESAVKIHRGQVMRKMQAESLAQLHKMTATL